MGGIRMFRARPAALAVVACALVAAALLAPRAEETRAAGPFDVTGLYSVRFVVPDTVLGFEIHANCYMRLVQTEQGAVDDVTARAVCYQVATMDPSVPPPPPPPYSALSFPVLLTMTGQIDAAGALSLTNDGCIVVPTGMPPVDTGLTFNISATAAKTTGIDSGTVDLVLDQTAPLVCDEPASLSQAMVHSALSMSHDDDIWGAPGGSVSSGPDGCTTWEELGNVQSSGGRRDPFNFWDLMDVPTGTSLVRDKSVTGADIAAIVGRFGSNDATAGDFDRASDPLSTPNATVTPSGARQNYHPGYDRGGSVGPNAWNLNAPDGSIGGGDIAAAVTQFGHNCVLPPN